jgi:hypothetical protein
LGRGRESSAYREIQSFKWHSEKKKGPQSAIYASIIEVKKIDKKKKRGKKRRLKLNK